jgi:peptidoglycan biosynthesis protein MviN/MurJ (putative lipid II flippase)
MTKIEIYKNGTVVGSWEKAFGFQLIPQAGLFVLPDDITSVLFPFHAFDKVEMEMIKEETAPDSTDIPDNVITLH